MQPTENNEPNTTQPQPGAVPEAPNPLAGPVDQSAAPSYDAAPAAQPAESPVDPFAQAPVQPAANPFGAASNPEQQPVQQPVGSNPVAYAPVNPVPGSGGPKKPPVKLIVIIASILVVLGLGYFVGLPLLNKAAPGLIPAGVVPSGGLAAVVAGMPLTDYESTTGKFSLKVPKEWVAKEDSFGGSMIVTFNKPGENVLVDAADTSPTAERTPVTVSLLVICSDTSSSSDGTKYTKEKLFESYKTREDVEGTTITSEGEVTVNGLSAYKIVGNFVSTKDGETKKTFGASLSVYINESRSCSVSLGGPESETELQASADTILGSFKTL